LISGLLRGQPVVAHQAQAQPPLYGVLGCGDLAHGERLTRYSKVGAGFVAVAGLHH